MHSFEKILLDHSFCRIRQAYPTARYMGHKATDIVIALPLYRPGSVARRQCKTALSRNPQIQDLLNLVHGDRLYLLILASYTILDIDPDKCELRDWIKTFGYTVNPELMLRVQQHYIQVTRTSTQTYRQQHQIIKPTDDDVSLDSFERPPGRYFHTGRQIDSGN